LLQGRCQVRKNSDEEVYTDDRRSPKIVSRSLSSWVQQVIQTVITRMKRATMHTVPLFRPVDDNKNASHLCGIDHRQPSG
jgi:hypothetical protein